MVCGEQCVTVIGVQQMQLWHVDSWDTLVQVHKMGSLEFYGIPYILQ